MKNFIDEQAKRIDYFDERFYQTPTENWVYSVNHILKARSKGENFERWLKQSAFMADKIANEAAEDGTNVHYLTELYDNGVRFNNIDKNEMDNPIAKYNKFVWNNFLRYVYFREFYSDELEILHIEKSLADDKLDYGGTIDRVVRFRGELMIWDIKSGGEYDTTEYQLAAYAELWNKKNPKLKIDSTAAFYTNATVRTEKDEWEKKGVIQGKHWKLKKMTRPYQDAYKTFKAVKYIFDDMEENRGKTSKDRKPKNMSVPMFVDPNKPIFKK